MTNQRGRPRGRGSGTRGTRIVAPSNVLHPDSSTPMQQVGISRQVIESENAVQTPSTSIGSTAANVESTSHSNVRGITRGQGVRKAMRSAKGRLTVRFNFDSMVAICDNAEAFNNEIGYIVRKHCSFKYKEWRLVPPEVRIPLRHKLLTIFDIDVDDQKVQQVIDNQMHKAWRNRKYKLHTDFKNIGGEEDPVKAKNIGHADVSKEDWDYLCDMWSDTSYKEQAQKNAESRGKRKYETRNGSKSTARYHVSRGVEIDAPTGQIETWRITNWHSENGWLSQEAETKYEEMLQLRRDNPPEKMTDKVILEKVLGRQSNRLFGWGRSPSKSRGTCSGDSSRPTYNQLRNELEEQKSRVKTLENAFLKLEEVLIEKNIVSHSSLSHILSDHAEDYEGPSERPSHRHESNANDQLDDEFDDFY